MCIICVDLQKDKLTWREARRNLGEVHTKLEKDHILEVGPGTGNLTQAILEKNPNKIYFLISYVLPAAVAFPK